MPKEIATYMGTIQVFTGHIYNSFALTKLAFSGVGREPIEYAKSLDEVDTSRKCLFPIPAHHPVYLRPRDGKVGYVFELIEECGLDYFKLPNMVLCLDAAGEGFPLDAVALDHAAERLASYGLSAERVLYLTSDITAARRYTEWCETTGRCPAMTPVTFDVQLYYYAGETRKELTQYEALYVASLRAATQRLPRKRKYLSLNRLSRHTRLAIPLVLLKADLLKDGFVSFHGRNVEKGPPGSPDWSDDTVILDWFHSLRLEQSLIDLFPSLEALAPLRLDEERDQPTMAYGPFDLSYYRDSYFSIVTETVFEDSLSELRLTEKTWKPIAHCHPFVMVGNGGILRELRRKGFQTFHPFIDERYDDVSEPAERFRLIRREIERLCALDHSQLAELYAELWPRLMHNFSLFHFGAGELLAQEDLFLHG